MAFCRPCPAGERALCPGEEASISPDGKTLLFQRFSGGWFRVGRRDLATGRESWLRTDDGHSLQPAWLPDGRVVYTWGFIPETAFAADAAGRKAGYNLWLWENGTNRMLTTGFQRDYAAAASPDGRTILYASTRGAAAREQPGQFINASYLFSVRLDGSPPQPMHELPGLVTGTGSPRMSPDGRFVAWSEVKSFTRDTWRLMAAASGNIARNVALTPDTLCAYSPAWHPKGPRLAFTGFTPGDPGWGIYLIHAPSASLKRVADGRNPSFSPDGGTLVYDRGGVIYARDLADGDWPAPSGVPEAEAPDDALVLRAKIRYRAGKGYAHVAKIAYPEHPLGLQVFFRDGNRPILATRRPNGSYAAVESDYGFKDGETGEIVAVRRNHQLALKVGGRLNVLANDTFLPLSPEPTKIEKGVGFAGEILSFSLSRGPTDAIPPPPRRSEIFGEVEQ